jgi:hypothetical protein
MQFDTRIQTIAKDKSSRYHAHAAARGGSRVRPPARSRDGRRVAQFLLALKIDFLPPPPPPPPPLPRTPVEE